MKKILNVFILSSCISSNTPLKAGGDRYQDTESEQRRYQEQNDHALAVQLQEELNQRDLKHTQQYSPPPAYNPAHVAYIDSRSLARNAYAQLEQQTEAEKRRNADARRKQLLIEERESLWIVIKSLEREIHYKRTILDRARYSFEIDDLRRDIRNLEQQRSAAIKRCDYLDREINRSFAHDDREIERREIELNS